MGYEWKVKYVCNGAFIKAFDCLPSKRMFPFTSFQGLVVLLFCLSECQADNTIKREFDFAKGPIQGQIPTTGFLEESTVRSVTDCARACAENQNCTAMYYLKDIKDCKIHPKKMSTLNGTLISNPAVVYYEIERIEDVTTTTRSISVTTTLAAATSTNAPNVHCPLDDSVFQPAETSDGTMFYFRFFMDIYRTFNQAKTFCQSLNATLYTVLTPEKFNFTQQLMLCPGYYTNDFWANGEDIAGTWMTTDEEPLPMTSTFWAPNRPINPACLCLALKHNYYFDDKPCDFDHVYTICEKHGG